MTCTAPPTLHFTHTGLLCISHTSGPLHLAVAPNLKCSFPGSSLWLAPSRPSSFCSIATSSKKPSNSINLLHNCHEQIATFSLECAHTCHLPFPSWHLMLALFPAQHMWMHTWSLLRDSIVALLGPSPHLGPNIIPARGAEMQ